MVATAGPFAFTASVRLIDFMRQADEPGLINLAAGVPGLEALPREALEAAFTMGFAREGARMLAYHHPEGDHELRELIAARLSGRGAPVQGREIVAVTGCTQALQLLLTVAVRPGDIVACEAPAYYGLLELLSAAGARVLPLAVAGGEGIDVDAAEPLLEQWRPKCLVVCTALSNPSGATMPEENRERLVAMCRRLKIRVIDDDIYAELLEGTPPAPLRKWDPEGEIVSYASSFCKSVAPGLRVGMCVPWRDRHEEVATLKCQQDMHSAVVTEVALREFLKAGAMEPHLNGLRVRNRRRRELALEAITRSFPEGTRTLPPRGGYMLWAELPRKMDLTPIRQQARAAGIVFGAGDAFFAAMPEKTCVRLNCAKATEEELVRGIEVLGGILRG
jgi:DNA-binding transcriptional MocR family regulator